MEKITQENVWNELIELRRKLKELPKKDRFKLNLRSRILLKDDVFIFYGIHQNYYTLYFYFSSQVLEFCDESTLSPKTFHKGDIIGSSVLTAVNELFEFCGKHMHEKPKTKNPLIAQETKSSHLSK